METLAQPTPNAAPLDSGGLGPVALALSGGGYRAAAFHLGVMDILHRLGLLELAALSTASGGTIVAVRFVAGRARQTPEAFDAFFTNFHRFLHRTNVMEQALHWLDKHPHAPRSVIVGASNVYAAPECLGDMRLSEVITPKAPPPLEASFNATDFSTGLSFRFQRSQSGLAPIGNIENATATPFAADIRLADVAAASSCFPGAFEPYQLPSDFPHLKGKPVKAVALMDGGIYDNQGIDALLLCLDRMKRMGQPVGLIAISDTNQKSAEDFLPPQRDRRRHGWKIGTLLKVGAVGSIMAGLSALGIAGTAIAKYAALDAVTAGSMLGAALLLGVLAAAGPLAWHWVRTQVTANLPTHLRSLWPFVKGLHIADLIDMLSNRVHSVMVMMTDVFMKRIRDLSMRRIFADDAFAGRRVGFFVYDLMKPVKETDRYKPSAEQARIGKAANDMATTLWATEEELHNLITCGQNTAVLKLLIHLKEREEKGALSASCLSARATLEELWGRLGKDSAVLLNERLVGVAPEAATGTRVGQKAA